MKILFAAAEAAPFIKIGGLGDVMGSLPGALTEHGIESRIVLPLYSTIKYNPKWDLEFVGDMIVNLGWRNLYCGIFQKEWNGILYYFLDNEQYFNRERIYGEFDDGERFAFFSKAVTELLSQIAYEPDIIHVNDWHTALVPVYLDLFYKRRGRYTAVKTILTIHNIEFQGRFNPYILGNLFGIEDTYKSLLLYDGDINILKAGIEMADQVMTVSETYAKEILSPYFSFGLHNILQQRSYKLAGIVNGIDTDIFNPEADVHLPYHFNASNIRQKTSIRKILQQELMLEEDSQIPLIGMVGRITSQKGFDLILTVMEEIAQLDLQFVLVGNGDPYFEQRLSAWEKKHRDKIRCIIAYSPEMAAKIYASSTMFLMPSKTEPCGLAQMIAMRYGAIPIVHSVGGLRDTVQAFDAQNSTGNGITFQSYNAYDMLDAIHRSLQLFQDKKTWRKLVRNAMTTDFSWNNSAKKYVELYENLIKNN